MVQRLALISLETPQHKWASYRLGGNLLDFLELRQVLSTFDGDLSDPLCWLRKGQSPCELLGGFSGATGVSSPVDAGP